MERPGSRVAAASSRPQLTPRAPRPRPNLRPRTSNAAARSVINAIQNSEIRNLFNPENVFVSAHGGGAGNNWASGYHQGESVQEDILDMIGAHSRGSRGRKGGKLPPGESVQEDVLDVIDAHNSSSRGAAPGGEQRTAVESSATQ